MTSYRLKPLTESSLLSALTVILALAAVYLPVVGMAAALVWALPIIVLVVRHGLRWGIMAVLVSGIIMALLIEPMISLRMVLSFAPTGLMLGVAFREQWSGAKTFGSALLVSIVAKLLSLGFLFLVTSVNPLSLELEAMKGGFNQTFAIYEQMGMDPAALEKSREDIARGMEFLSMLLPLVVFIMGLFDTVLGYLVGSRVLRRLGHQVPQLPPFSEWHLPQFFLYLLGFALVGLYWGGTREIKWLYQIAMNLNMVAMFAGIVQGLSLMSYVMKRYRVRRVLRLLFYLLVLTAGPLMQILAFTGLFDMAFDYRRRFGNRSR